MRCNPQRRPVRDKLLHVRGLHELLQPVGRGLLAQCVRGAGLHGVQQMCLGAVNAVDCMTRGRRDNANFYWPLTTTQYEA
jgi:hypothetical protein